MEINSSQTNPLVIERANVFCKLNKLNPDTFIRIDKGDYAGTGYHTTQLALVVKYLDALDVGFSTPFVG